MSKNYPTIKTTKTLNQDSDNQDIDWRQTKVTLRFCNDSLEVMTEVTRHYETTDHYRTTLELGYIEYNSGEFARLKDAFNHFNCDATYPHHFEQ